MNDKEFEKYFESIECIFDSWFVSTIQERKDELKQILEEIENNAKGEVLHQVFDKEAKP